MFEDEYSDVPQKLLACGHLWDGVEDWPEMLVILKGEINGPDGASPDISISHFCRACRMGIVGERLASMAEARDWLKSAQEGGRHGPERAPDKQ